MIPSDKLTEEYSEACGIYNETTGYKENVGTKYVNIYYLEDSVLRAYLEEHNIDPEPYLDTENPMALVMGSKIVTYRQTEESYEKIVYETDVFDDTGFSLFLFDNTVPATLADYLERIPSNHYWVNSAYQGYPMKVYCFTDSLDESVLESTPYLQSDATLSVVMIPQENADGTYDVGYYLYDPSNDALSGEPIAINENPQSAPNLLIGETVRELPFGISSNTNSEYIALVMPLSMVNTEDYLPNLLISVNNYEAIISYLDEQELYYQDLLESQMQYRNMVTMINVFSYGFIILISLICICNVFNTISTNIALRRRDFGMLRSVGMQNRELNRMMIFECLRYGIRALVMGLPLGILATFGIHALTGDVGNSNYEFPLIPIFVAIACVFIVVFISMLYALSRLKKDNPIDAIRMENL